MDGNSGSATGPPDSNRNPDTPGARNGSRVESVRRIRSSRTQVRTARLRVPWDSPRGSTSSSVSIVCRHVRPISPVTPVQGGGVWSFGGPRSVSRYVRTTHRNRGRRTSPCLDPCDRTSPRIPATPGTVSTQVYYPDLPERRSSDPGVSFLPDVVTPDPSPTRPSGTSLHPPSLLPTLEGTVTDLHCLVLRLVDSFPSSIPPTPDSPSFPGVHGRLSLPFLPPHSVRDEGSRSSTTSSFWGSFLGSYGRGAQDEEVGRG